jgi:hypothetical protein
MFEAAKSTAKRFGMKARVAIEGMMILFVLLCFLGVKTHHAKADIELIGWNIGGGTSDHLAQQEQVAMLGKALPVSAIEVDPIGWTGIGTT